LLILQRLLSKFRLQFIKISDFKTKNMVVAVTDGIKVSVLVQYQPEFSNPMQANFGFAYKVRIENQSQYTIQLLRRHWYIHDTNCLVREVEGEGVIGVQPVLEPGETHEYVSGCNLSTSVGKMRGTYLMERVMDGKQFTVQIPDFAMVASYKLN
jgi:ApaG protein